MRIIAGIYKNRILSTPRGLETRPTSGKLREALFNMVQHSIEGSAFLDLFAGSGGMALEALSRGADRVVFVDSSKDAIRSIEKNLASLGIKNSARIVRGDVFLSLKKMEKLGERFDIIYADPPYARLNEGKDSSEDFGERVLTAVDALDVLNEGGHLFIEEAKHVSLEELPLKTLKFVKKKQFGHASLFHFVKS